MTTSPPAQPPRSPADLGWDDATLWDDADVASYLRIDVQDVTAAVASGVPAIFLKMHIPDAGDVKAVVFRRFVPSVVREYCTRRSLSVAPPTTSITTWPSKHPRRYRGSGRLVQS